MADVDVGRMFVRLGLELDEFAAGLKEVESELSRRAAGFTQAGIALSAAITAPLAALSTSGVQTLAEFQKEMNKVSALGDIFGKDLAKLSDQAKMLGETTIYSAKQAAAAMGELAAQGFKTNEVYDAMPGVLALAATEGMKIADAAKISAAAIKQFGFEAKDMGQIADMMAAVSAESATSVQALGYSYQYVGSVARNLKQPFQEINAALGVLANAGRTGESAGTALRAMLLSLEAPTSKAAATMERLKINVRDANGQMLPMSELVKRLQPLLNEAGAGVKVFGKRWSDVSILLQNSGKDFENMNKNLMVTADRAKKSADIMRQGLAGMWEELSSQAEGVLLEIGTILEPLATQAMKIGSEILKAVKTAIDGFKQLDAPIQNAILAFGGLLAALGPVSIAIGGAYQALSVFSKLMPGITALFETGGIAMTTFSIAAQAVAVAVVAWDLLKLAGELEVLVDDVKMALDITASWKDALVELALIGEDVLGWVLEFIPGAAPLIDLLKDIGINSVAVGKYLSMAFEAVKMAAKDFATPLGVLIKAVKSFDEILVTITGKSAKVYEDMYAGTKNTIQGLMEGSRNAAAAAMEQMKVTNAAKTAAEKYKEMAEAAGRASTSAAEAYSKASKTKKKAVDEEAVALKALMETQRNMLEIDKKILEHQTRAHKQFASDVKEAIGKAILDWESLHAVIGDMDAWKKPTAALKQLEEQWSASVGTAIARTRELDGAFDRLGVTSVETLTEIRDRAKEAFETLQNAMDTGEIEYSYQVLLQANEKLLQAEKNLAIARGEAWDGFEEELQAVGDQLDTMAGKPSQIALEFEALQKNIDNAFGNLFDNLGAAIVKGEGFKEAFKSFFDDIGKAVQTFVSNILKGILKDALEGNIRSLKDLSKSATKAFTDIQKVFTGDPEKAGGIPTVGGAKQSQQAAQMAAGGLTGWITAISSAVSAVTGVLQYLQGRRMEQDIGRIEVTTREIKAELMNLRADEWTREKHLFALDAMAEATNRFGDAHGAMLSDILGTLQQILETLRSGVTFSGTGEAPIVVDMGGPQKSAVDRLQELADQTHLANQSLREMELQAQVTGGYTAVAGEAIRDAGNAFTEVAETVEETTKELEVGTEEYQKWKESLIKGTKDYDKWLQDRIDMEKRALRSTDRWGNTLDENGRIVMHSTQYLKDLNDSLKYTNMEFSGFTSRVDGLVLGTDLAADAMRKAALAAEGASGSFTDAARTLTAGIQKTSAALGSQAQSVGATPTGTNPGGSARSNAVWYNGQWVDPNTYLPISSTGSGIGQMTLNVNVNNADAAKVANTMVGTWRTAGVPI